MEYVLSSHPLSESSLKQFTLHDHNITTDDLLQFFPRIPYLELLHNRGTEVISNTFLDALGLKDGVPYLLPKLQELDFSDSPYVSGINLVRMAKGRMEIVTREKNRAFRLRVTTGDGITDEHVNLLDELEKEYAGVLEVWT
ncbi:hypothetical protein M422DRAFT_775596 [Sphaerobolus stellatus SS14]|nr:hypothetical protein M422DRAFT_775596 [Sphaerobolus stellatus SS14]